MKRRYHIPVAVAIVVLLLIARDAHAQAKPDLIVSKAVMTQDADGFADKITVTVTNGCRAAAGASYVLVSFKTSPETGSKTLYFVSSSVKALKGGESQVRVFDFNGKKIAHGRHVLVEADPYKKVAEASEDNNWRTLFPDGAGPALSQFQCAPKN